MCIRDRIRYSLKPFIWSLRVLFSSLISSLNKDFSIIPDKRRALSAIISESFLGLFIVCPTWVQKFFKRVSNEEKFSGNGQIPLPFISPMEILLTNCPLRYR